MTTEPLTPRKFAVMSRMEQDALDPDAPATELFFASDGVQQVGDDTRVYAEAARYAKALNGMSRVEQDATLGRLAPLGVDRMVNLAQEALTALAADDRQALAKATQPMMETQERALRSLLAVANMTARLGWEKSPWASLDRSGHGDPRRATAGHLVDLMIQSGHRAGWDAAMPPGTVTYATSALTRDPTGEFAVMVLVNLLAMLGGVQAQKFSPSWNAGEAGA